MCEKQPPYIDWRALPVRHIHLPMLMPNPRGPSWALGIVTATSCMMNASRLCPDRQHRFAGWKAWHMYRPVTMTLLK